MHISNGNIYGLPSELEKLTARWAEPRGYWRSEGDWIHYKQPPGNIVVQGWLDFFDKNYAQIAAWALANPEEIVTCSCS